MLIFDSPGSIVLPSSGGATITTAALLAAAKTTVQMVDDTGWMLTPAGAGSVTVADGSLVMVVPNGGTNVYQSAAHAIPDSAAWRIQYRVSMTSPGSVSSPANLVLRGLISHGGVTENLQFDFTGALSSGGSSLPRDGTLWIRCEGVGVGVRVDTGIGSGDTEPTTWTRRADNTRGTGGVGAPIAMAFSAVSEGAALTGGNATITIRCLSHTALSLPSS